MKKLLATSLVAVLLYQTTFSQIAFNKEPYLIANMELVTSSLSISGIVKGEQGQGLPFASVVLLLAKDSTLVKGMLASESGEYRVDNVGVGHYLLLASGAGYHNAYSAPFTLAPEAEARQVEIILPAASHQPGKIAVVQKPLFEQQPDKLVVHVQESGVAAGSTALDILACSPGVTLNRHHYSLLLNGKDDIMVMMDGKNNPLSTNALLQMLSSMKATNVERIELIYSQTKDKGGVINIILKPDVAYGTSGAFTFMAGYGAHQKSAASLLLTHRDKKLNWFVEYDFQRSHSRQEFENSKQVDYQHVITQTKDVITRNPLMKNHTASIGMDYDIGSRTTFSSMLSGYSNKWKINDEQIHTTVLQSDQLVNDAKVQHQEVNHLNHLMGNLAVQHRFNANQEVSLNFNYLYYYNNNPNQFTITDQSIPENSISQDQFNIYRQTPIKIWVSKANYARQFNTHTRFEAGLKGSSAGLANKVQKEMVQDGIRAIDTTNSHLITIREANITSYVKFYQQINAKTKLQAELHWEFTQSLINASTKGETMHQQYSSFLPYALFSHDFQEGNTFQLSYERRLIRPTFNNLAPYLYSIDPNSGNLSLKPALKQTIEVSYRSKEHNLLTLRCNYEKNPVIPWQVYITPENNQQYARAENLKHSQSYSLSFALPIRLNNWWQMQNGGVATWQMNAIEYEGTFLRLPAGFGSINSTQRFTFPHNFSAELAGFYQNRSPFGVAYLKAFGSLSLAVEKKLKKDSGTLKLTADDLLGTMGFALNTNQPALAWNHSFKGRFTEGCILKLTYSATIGNKYIKAMKGRTSGSEEEQKRVNN